MRVSLISTHGSRKSTRGSRRSIHVLCKSDARFEYFEKHLDTRLAEHAALFGQQLADLERRMTTRLGAVTVAAIGIVSALDKLL